MITHTTNSSYVRYLPPVLWSLENDLTQFLGRMLRVFEKILTGLPDSTAPAPGEHEDAPLATTIDQLADLFDPWRTRADFLPWLASWMALELQPTWSEYQQRKLMTEIVGIYQQRGQKAGLLAYLDIFTATKTRPRIVIDDGDALFRLVLNAGRVATVYPMASGEPLIHPQAMALDRRGNYIIADRGENIEKLQQVGAKLWKLAVTGESAANPELIYAGEQLRNPVAVVVETTGNYVVLDAAWPCLHRFSPSPKATLITTSNSDSGFAVRVPVDMVPIADGSFAILDRGAADPEPAQPQIVFVQEANGTSSITDRYDLTQVWEPTAIALDSNGKFLVADAGYKSASDAVNDQFRPADIYLIDRTTSPVQEVSLLALRPAGEPNPLIYPTALTCGAAGQLLVADLGMKPPPQKGRPAHQAEPAAVYRVDYATLATSPAIVPITLLSQERTFVWPTDIALDDQGAILLLDQGERQDEYPERSWRLHPNEFGVIVHFPTAEAVTITEQQKLLGSISRIVNAEKPAHTYWTLKCYDVSTNTEGA